nr:uncharacterized protein LOC109191598 [Ipomoea batatas]
MGLIGKKGEYANELEEFEGSEYETNKGDDQEFVKHVDPQVEYGGVQVPTNVEAEMHVDPQAADALNLSDDGAEFQTTARPIPHLDGSDWEEGEYANELEEFEGSEYETNKGDDQEFVKHVDPQVEYGGVQVPTNVEAEMHVDPQAADALNLSDDGAEFQTTARPIPQEAAAEEIPVNTQPFEELTDDELLRLFDCPILGIPNIGFHYVRVDPLLNVRDNIIANSLTNAQNMAINTSPMEIAPSSQLQFEEMDNTSEQ